MEVDWEVLTQVDFAKTARCHYLILTNFALYIGLTQSYLWGVTISSWPPLQLTEALSEKGLRYTTALVMGYEHKLDAFLRLILILNVLNALHEQLY